MKLDILEEELKKWGKLILTIEDEHVFEIHLEDNLNFDTDKKIMYITTSDAMYMILEGSIQFVTRHFAHKE